MKRKLTISVAAFVVAALAVWGIARAQQSNEDREKFMQERMILIQHYKDTHPAQPDRSPNWRAVSPDLGILLREDDHFGYRGTLYARVDGQWEPVAIDDIESFGYVPLNR